VISATSDENYALKAVSKNMKCALIYGGSILSAIPYSGDYTATVTPDIRTIPASLYTGVTIGVNTLFDVSDNCDSVKINGVLLTYYEMEYFADTFPSVSGASLLVNPGFSDDFSIAVVDTGIYKYSPKTATTHGSYSLARNETFDAKKKVWILENSLVIFSWA
jgi:hypothetical protein